MKIRKTLRLPRLDAILYSVRGGKHVRAHHRGDDRRKLYRCYRIALPLMLLSGAAHATPPLMPATDVAQVGLVGWWRTGELLVGIPDAPDRPGMRPLVSTTPAPLPGDLSSWEPVGHSCEDPPRGVAAIGSNAVEGVVLGDEVQPVIALMQGDRIVAQNALGHPATVCEIRIVQADKLPGLELVVAWRMTGEAPVQGITVFRIPEALQSPPSKKRY
jgi:hypothetical protein